MATVSVCMITYNHEKYITEAIEAILNQKITYDVELIIANDASRDRSDDLIQQIIKTHPKGRIVKYFKHNENLGMMPNFIFALQKCKGKYIALCEGDDYWTDETKLQKQIDFLETNIEYTGCFHNVMVANDMIANFNIKPWRTYTKKEFELIDVFSKTSLFHTSSFVFRKHALIFPQWFKKVKSGDMALFALIASKGKLKLIDGHMSVYRKNEGGVTTDLKTIDYHRSRIQLISFFILQFNKHVTHLKSIRKFHKLEILKVRINKIKKLFKK